MKFGSKKKAADLNRSISSCSSSSSVASSSRNLTTPVLAVECISSTSNSNDWSSGIGNSSGTSLLQTGDIVEEIRIGNLVLQPPFKNGRSGVQKILGSSYQNNQTSIVLRFRPASRSAEATPEARELQAWIVPSDSGKGKKQYVLRLTSDPLIDIRFFDCTESECLELQASRSTKIQQTLTETRVQDGYESYPWERKMQEGFKNSSSSFLSILMFPKASSDDNNKAPRFNTVEDTLARADAWLHASQSSGVPIICTNIQTESLLTKISGDKATSSVSSITDLPNLANISLYGLEDYHGVDIGIVRAVRLWYTPIGGEYKVTMDINDQDTKLGFVISRTEEGFIYVSSVLEGDENVPASRSGLRNLFREATKASKLLVVSRINNQKILPWIVSQQGKVRCFDTVSLSQKLSMHRHAKTGMLLHVFMWESTSQPPTRTIGQVSSNSSSPNYHQALVPSPLLLEPGERDEQLRNRASAVDSQFAPDNGSTQLLNVDDTVRLRFDYRDAELESQREMLNDIQSQRRKLDEMLDNYLKARDSHS